MSPSRQAAYPCGTGKKYKQGSESPQSAQQANEDAVLVCIPTRGQINYETVLALLSNLRDVKHLKCIVGRKPVIEARNLLANWALEAGKVNPFPFKPREVFALWIDDDAWFPEGLVSAMLKAMRAFPKIDALFGNFCGRTPYANTIAYRDARNKDSFPKIGVDCQPGEIVEIERAGFHLVLMRISLLERVGDNPFEIPDDAPPGTTEDLAFCDRAKSVGATLAVGTGFPVLHIDPRDGTAYAPGMPVAQMDGNAVRRLTHEHMVDGTVKKPEQRAYGADVDEKILRAKVG